jgi:hypothetical protein
MRIFMLVLVIGSGAAWAKPRHPSRVGEIAGPVALQIHGEDADSDKRARCRETMRDHGAQLDDKAAVKIVIRLESLNNYLRVVSASRGVVVEERLPAWTMEKLCTHSLARGNRVVAEENAAR